MTGEEAIEILKTDSCMDCGVGAQSPCTCEFDGNCDIKDATEMAIKALEQETVSKESYDHEYFLRKELDFKVARLEKQIAEQKPCEDAISRTEVIDELNRLGRNAFKEDTDYDNFFAFLDGLPPVTPTIPTCEDAVSRTEVTRANRMKMLDELAFMETLINANKAKLLLECERDLEKLEKIEELINDPANRVEGAVSIKEIREVLG